MRSANPRGLKKRERRERSSHRSNADGSRRDALRNILRPRTLLRIQVHWSNSRSFRCTERGRARSGCEPEPIADRTSQAQAWHYFALLRAMDLSSSCSQSSSKYSRRRFSCGKAGVRLYSLENLRVPGFVVTDGFKVRRLGRLALQLRCEGYSTLPKQDAPCPHVGPVGSDKPCWHVAESFQRSARGDIEEHDHASRLRGDAFAEENLWIE